MDNTNFQTIHQMGNAINNVIRQAMCRDNVQNIDMDYVTVAQRKKIVEEIITGNPVSFVTNIVEPLDYLIVQIEPVQSGSGDPSPDNVRPISGWTECNVSRMGKNLFNEADAEQTISTDRYAVLENGLLHFKNDGSGWMYTKAVSVYLKTGTYVLSLPNYRLVSGDDPIWIIKAYGQTSYPVALTPYVLSITEDTTVEIRLTTSGTTSASEFYANIQLEVGSSASTYEPYHATQTKTYPFPSEAGTVYGGTLTVNKDGTGTLVVEWVSVDLGDLTWSKNATYINLMACSPSGIKNASSTERKEGIVSSKYKISSTTALNDTMNNFSMLHSGTTVVVKDTTLAESTEEEIKTAMSGVQLVYELATPVTYNLTSLEVIETLLGTNNIWADTGNVTVLYKNYEEVI